MSVDKCNGLWPSAAAANGFTGRRIHSKRLKQKHWTRLIRSVTARRRRRHDPLINSWWRKWCSGGWGARSYRHDERGASRTRIKSTEIASQCWLQSQTRQRLATNNPKSQLKIQVLIQNRVKHHNPRYRPVH